MRTYNCSLGSNCRKIFLKALTTLIRTKSQETNEEE